jgi:sigma-B regulation protein RsbU (phosphoserine phosphatase)
MSTTGQGLQSVAESARGGNPVASGLACRLTPPAPDSVTHPGQPAGPKARELILLADDDPVCLALAQNVLEKGGYDVVTAANGLEALDTLEHQSPGLVLLDLEMPGLSGFDVCRRMKADARYADIPIIFLTVTSDPKVKAEGFHVGGGDYVTKPIEHVELLARIRCHLELAASRQALRSRANLYEAVAAEQMTRLEQVRDGQASILTAPGAFGDFEVAVRFVPAHEAGGDFYEISRFSENQFGVLVTDVAGHDLSVPFITGALKGLVALCLNETLNARETMIMLNSGLRRFLSCERFVSGCYAKIDRENGEIEIVSAGHPPALVQRRQGGCEYIQAVGDVLGMYERVTFEADHLQVSPGDRLFLYTDGLIEGYADEQGRRGRALFGLRRLQQQVQELWSLPLRTVVNTVVDRLIEENGGNVADDVVLLGIEF